MCPVNGTSNVTLRKSSSVVIAWFVYIITIWDAFEFTFLIIVLQKVHFLFFLINGKGASPLHTPPPL